MFGLRQRLVNRPLAQALRAKKLTWRQRWLEVLFLHWQVPPQEIAAQLPAGIELETAAGAAWVSIVLFRLEVRPAWLPHVPGVSALTEVNFRTYVRRHERPGIYFLGMQADNRWSIRLARLLTPLPYVHAPLDYRRRGARYVLRQEQSPDHSPPLSLAFECGEPTQEAAAGSHDAWLLERYRLFAVDARRGLVEAQVRHAPWQVQAVRLLADSGRGNTFGPAPARQPDAMHFSAGVSAAFEAFQVSATVDSRP